MHFDYSTQQKPSDLDTAMSTVAARIIHDIVNPLGAVSNGLELLELSGFPKTEEFKLLQDSVHHANAKIRALRLAFGPIKSDAPIPSHHITDVISTIFPSGRYDIDQRLPDTIPPQAARIMSLLALCMSDAIPFGGQISLSLDHVQFQSKKHVDLTEFEALAAGKVQMSAPKIHFFYVQDIFAQCQETITLAPLRDGARLALPSQLVSAKAA